MRLYLAGIYTSNFHREGGRVYNRLLPPEKVLRDSATNFLESYHYINKQPAVDRINRDGVKIFLDSGAFSAFTKGIEVDLPAYCAYIHRNADMIEVASVLDGIGDPLKTWQNQQKMEQLGTRPLPCFHYGEDEEYLKWYVENYDHITLGGMVPISTQQLYFWLDRIFNKYLTHSDGSPKLKVHAFGLTSLPLTVRYPWYSVDSSTWVQWAANGMILVPGVGQVNISSKSSGRKVAGQHLDNISPEQRDAIEARLIQVGIDPDRLRDIYYSRWAYNIWSFPYWFREKDYTKDTFQVTQKGLF
jgi:hypothetical protein